MLLWKGFTFPEIVNVIRPIHPDSREAFEYLKNYVDIERIHKIAENHEMLCMFMKIIMIKIAMYQMLATEFYQLHIVRSIVRFRFLNS